MKINCNREALVKKLQLATSVMGNSSIIPIYMEALINVEKDKISINTTDGSITMKCSLNVSIGEEESIHDFVCDIQSILSTITLLRDEDVLIEVVDKDVILSTPKSRKKFTIPITHNPGDFPRTDNEWKKEFLSIPGDVLSPMIKSSASVVNTNNLIPEMTGISMSVEKGKLVLKSCHNSIICINSYTIPEEKVLKIKDMIIPKGSVKVIGAFEKSPEIKIFFDNKGNNIMFDDGVSVAQIRLIDGVFPEVNKFFEKLNLDVLTIVNRTEFMNAIKRVSSFTSKSTLRIEMDFSGEGMVLKGVDIDFRKNAEEFLPTEKKADEMNFRTAINYTFGMTAVQSLASENITISQLEGKELMVISESVSEKFTPLWLIMPMLLG